MGEPTVTLTLHVDPGPFVRAMGSAQRAMHGLTIATMRPERRRKHKIRCSTCSPRANPKPLAIDGHAYRRRTKRRRT